LEENESMIDGKSYLYLSFVMNPGSGGVLHIVKILNASPILIEWHYSDSTGT
jgi:hypothetical protein